LNLSHGMNVLTNLLNRNKEKHFYKNIRYLPNIFIADQRNIIIYYNCFNVNEMVKCGGTRHLHYLCIFTV